MHGQQNIKKRNIFHCFVKKNNIFLNNQCIFNDSVSTVPTVDGPVGEGAQTETRQAVCCNLRSPGKCLSSTNVMC